MNIQDSSRRVVVTGMGVVSALGSTLDSFWNAIREGRSGVRAVGPDESYPTTRIAPVDDFTGKIQDFGELDDAKKKAIRKGVKLMAREIQLGVASAQKAIADASLVGASSDRVGVSFASDYVVTVPQELRDAIAACRAKSDDGGIVFDGSHWRENGLSKMTPLWQLKYLTNMSASHITIYNEFFGPAFDVTNRESSFAGALADAAETIRSGRADAMVVGATGSRIHPLRLIEAIKNDEIADDVLGGEGDGVCRPFDARRCGTIPGEGAGAIVIESLETAQRRGARILAEVVGGAYRGVFKTARSVGAVGPDSGANDVVSTLEDSRESIRLTLRALLAKTGVSASEIGHINANARGDVRLDAAEALALRDVFGDALDSIPTTTLKGALGNPGAGAGAIETVASILALRENALFPIANYEAPDEQCRVAPVREFGAKPGDSFVKICAQTIGQSSAVLIKRWNG